jgi:serine/threonine protein kinase
MSRPGSLVCERCGAALALVPGTVLPGQRDRYRLEKHLKSGGFGSVYKATRLSDNLTVAIKEMICPDPSEQAIRYELFDREAKILKNARAFRIVPEFYEFFGSGSDAYLALEFISGMDLYKAMQQSGRGCGMNEVLDWATQICDVLNWMHTQNPPMVHRDLKPENIMLLSNGTGIKMIDFGTVRASRKPVKTQVGSSSSATQFIYTEGYAPIEQIGGKPEPRSDLFALAATIYHLLTNQWPSGKDTPPLVNVLPSCPRWMSELVQINLQEDPADRYACVADFKQDLVNQQVTTSVLCTACQATCPARTPYCSQCGAALSQTMLFCRCGQMNVAGTKYCIFCGHKL